MSTAAATGYDRSVSSSAIIKLVAGAFLGLLLITGALVLTTDLRVEDSGPIIVLGVSLACVFLLLFAPTEGSR